MSLPEPHAKRRARRNLSCNLPAVDEGGIFTFNNIEPQSLRTFWQEKIDDEYSGMYKKMKVDFWFFGETHQGEIWPENVEVTRLVIGSVISSHEIEAKQPLHCLWPALTWVSMGRGKVGHRQCSGCFYLMRRNDSTND